MVFIMFLCFYALSFGVATEEASSPAMKRKMVRHVIVPARNMNTQRYQTGAACSTGSSDGSLGSRMSFPTPSVPDKTTSMGDGKSAEPVTEGWEGERIQGPKSAGGCIQLSRLFFMQFWLHPLRVQGNLSTVKGSLLVVGKTPVVPIHGEKGWNTNSKQEEDKAAPMGRRKSI